MSEVIPLDPSQGNEMFRERDGERWIPMSDLVALDPAGARLFVAAIRDYMATHPRLEVRFWEAKAEDALVVKWRWRRE